MLRRELKEITKQPFHVMVKPIGPICNLRCDYCFYLHKKELFSNSENFKMTDDVLEHFVQEYIKSQPGPEVPFAWQGGEPTLMGVDFFRKVVQLQKKYIPSGWRFTNALQTNGILIDDEWAQFLKEEQFLVGLSLDGPKEIHNMYRQDSQGNGTWTRVMETFRLLQRYGVDVNLLCVVNKQNAAQPEGVYEFYRELGAEYVQFIPLVEQLDSGHVSDRSVTGPLYGKFLITIFNKWLQDGLGDIFIQIFEEALTAAAGMSAGICVFCQECGRQLVMEHNGDVYSCDHYVLPENRLGNVMESPLLELVNSDLQKEFGHRKGQLPSQCVECPVVGICNGGCPKNRIYDYDGLGLNWLCEGYRQFFSYVDPFLQEILRTLRQGKSAVQAKHVLMELLTSTWDVSRNDPCPCGSGMKYKKCCGR